MCYCCINVGFKCFYVGVSVLRVFLTCSNIFNSSQLTLFEVISLTLILRYITPDHKHTLIGIFLPNFEKISACFEMVYVSGYYRQRPALSYGMVGLAFF